MIDSFGELESRRSPGGAIYRDASEKGALQLNPAAKRDTCAVCAGPLTLHEKLLWGVCQQYACRQSERMGRLTARRETCARRLGIDDPESFPLACVPSNERLIRNLPERRRRRFRDFVTRLISEATAHSDGSAPGPEPGRVPRSLALHGESGDELALLAHACTTCGGYCCHQGRDHAFLDVDTIRRYMAEHPEQRPRHVLENFLSHLPNRSHQDACVYQSVTGCALPRGMRADLCNAYYCPSLGDLREELARRGTTRAFAVSEERFQLPVRSAFIDEKGLRCIDDRDVPA
jgi:hypothetical protein